MPDVKRIKAANDEARHFGRDGAVARSAPCSSGAQREAESCDLPHSFRPLLRGRGRRKRTVPTKCGASAPSLPIN